MDAISVATTAYSGLKVAGQIASGLRDIDVLMKSAEYKMQIIELVDRIADSKMAVSEVQEALVEKDREIRRLSELLSQRESVVYALFAYYRKKANGKPVGEPYCAPCFEVRNNLVHLTRCSKGIHQAQCPECKATFPELTTILSP
ncbi:hypothetical protein [Dokdonella immobilis]|uniref:Uncharacterized protein n=1 Tax=Dokdonella immobilis TaxID=578942 RepID=A0A1I4VUG5_9GAMM|nr:hypothetical protein [Dokdonella immobilis]SFN04941.1 hypothetical protein SAMN05216289_10369 [Dokdonella immobilis]